MAYAIHHAGIRRGGRACALLGCWLIAETRLGHELGGDVEGFGHLTAAAREYSEYWNQSERTTWRELQAFREAFPGEDTPARLVAELRANAAVAVESKSAAVAQLADVALAA